ncbi:hypothetical protein BD414DRAFT_482028 [Trametes punicea]|nr:hypothetical protein BD414DRAFT_482028 [Trametes punicea]
MIAKQLILNLAKMKAPAINVSSRENSPDAEPRRTTRSSKARMTRSKRPISAGDIIELTDSDSDDLPMNLLQPFPSQSKRPLNKRKALVEPVAGPSRPHAEAPHAVGAAPAAEPHPAESLPLFLPDPGEQDDLASGTQPAPAAVTEPVEQVPPMTPSVENASLEPPSLPDPALEPAPDDRDPLDAFVAQVLEIVPDVLPSHAHSLIEQHYPRYLDKVVEPVLHILLENTDYPKANAKGKGKRRRDEADDEQAARVVRTKIDYGSVNRRGKGGPYYVLLAMEQLTADFPSIPTAHIRQTLTSRNWLYAPTFLALREHQALSPLPYKPITRPRPKGKGKAVAQHDEELEREIQWVREKVAEEEAKKAAEVAEELRLQEEGGIECGCCFCEYPFDKMIQCPEAHLFCTSCMMTYAETKLGEHDSRIVCMDQSGCKLPFPESELRRFLTPKLLELYERVKQRKDIEAAGLENLEECPFCDYKVVIENEQERLFRCENEACGAITCRQCKKPDHLPRSCQEVSEDRKLDIRHAIEEAMTRALMRNCPKCEKAFIKEMGCNKMTCPNCGSMSCYVCRKLISGYEHFSNQPPPYTGKADPNKCTLWDASVEGRHSDEVTAAAKQAIEEYKRTHPELDEKDLAIELPPPPPVAGPSRPGAAHVGHGPMLPLPLDVERQVFDPPFAGFHALPQLGRLERRAAEREARADLVRMWQRGVERDRAARIRALRAAVPPPPAPPYAPEAHHHGPVYNVQVQINHAQPQPQVMHGPVVGPAPQPVFFPAPLHGPIQFPPPPPPLVPVPAPVPAPAPAPAPAVAPRRSRRAHGRRAN